MLPAIEFDCELARRAGEIDHALADRVLPAEFPWQPVLAQGTPELLLDIGRIAA